MKVVYTVFSFCKAFCLLKVLDITSPQHVTFLNTALSLYLLLKCRITTGDYAIFITIDFIFLLVKLFAISVFNEMIIINICGLNENTKEGLLLKEKQEFEDRKNSISSFGNISDDDDLEDEDKEKAINEV